MFGWMNGTFRVPPQQPFLDFLTLGTLGVQILKLTRAPGAPVAIVNLTQAVGISDMQ